MNFSSFLSYRSNYDNAIHEYLKYAFEKSEAYAVAINGMELAPLHDAVRQMHTYVTGTSGTGKTELLKVLVHHDLMAGNAAVIIDPQTNFARAVAAWPEFAERHRERLVYINPSIQRGYAPALNPLDASKLSDEGKEALAKSLTDVLAQVGGRNDWTAQTETVAHNCFKILVHQPGATLHDLSEALVPFDKRDKEVPANVKAMRDAGLRHKNRQVRDFFEHDFLSAQFSSSRSSLRGKISGLLRDDLFVAITCQPSKIHLEELIDQRKIIVFDLGAWGDSQSAGAFGRMVLAQLTALGTRRAMEYEAAKTAVHVYVDEADLFVSPSMLFILSKLRQHGVHLTLAQQTPGYGYHGQDRHQLLNNTSIKFAAGKGQGEVLKMMGVPSEATKRLQQGQFIGQWGNGEPFKLTVRRDIRGRTMAPGEWADILGEQIAAYYAQTDQAEAIALPGPETPTEAPEEAANLTPAEKLLHAPEESEWPE